MADKLIDRLKDEAFAGIKPGADEGEALGEMVEELETAPEIDQLHEQIGRPPPTPVKIGQGARSMSDGLEGGGDADALGSPPKEYSPDEK